MNGVDIASSAHIGARTYKGIELINVSNIKYIRVDQKYVSVRFAGRQAIIEGTLREVQSEFEDIFFWINRNGWVTNRHTLSAKKCIGKYRRTS